MRRINKSREPESLTDFKRAYKGSDWTEIHKAENENVYLDCLKQCISDQDGLCGYTEVCLDNGVRHIDHYVKRAFDPTLTYSWGNMIAAVKDSNFGADWKDNSISSADYDSSKQSYKNILNPVTDNFSGRFKFSTDGYMEPTDSNDTLAAETIRVFNLNANSLMARRKQSMINARHMYQGNIGKTDIISILKSGGFISAIEYELSKA